MYLADTDEYKETFEIFISYPEDKKLRDSIDKKIDVLLGDNHTSYTLNGKGGWALFSKSSDTPLSQEVKDFLYERIMSFIYHDIEYGPSHDRTIDTVLYTGIEIIKDTEVDCFYFYDDIRRYR